MPNPDYPPVKVVTREIYADESEGARSFPFLLTLQPAVYEFKHGILSVDRNRHGDGPFFAVAATPMDGRMELSLEETSNVPDTDENK